MDGVIPISWTAAVRTECVRCEMWGHQLVLSKIYDVIGIGFDAGVMMCVTRSRGRPNFGYGFGYGARTSSKMTLCPVSVSANVVSAKFPLRP